MTEEEYNEKNYDNADMREYFDFSTTRYAPVFYNKPSGLEFVAQTLIFDTEEEADIEGKKVQEAIATTPTATNEYRGFVVDMNEVKSVPGYLPINSGTADEYDMFVFILKRVLQ